MSGVDTKPSKAAAPSESEERNNNARHELSSPMARRDQVTWDAPQTETYANVSSQQPSNGNSEKQPGFQPRRAKVAEETAAQTPDDLGTKGDQQKLQSAMKSRPESATSYRPTSVEIADQSVLEEEQQLWDQFESIPIDESDASATEQCVRISTVLLKLFMYGLLFACILFGFVLIKASFLTLTTRLSRCSTTGNDDLYSAWVYITLIAVSSPYFLTFLLMGFKIIFGQYKWPSLPILIWTLLIESAHTFGLALFLISVLPNLDAVRGLLATLAVGIIPSLLNLALGLKPRQNACKKIAFTIMDVLAILGQLSGIATLAFLMYSNNGKLANLTDAMNNVDWRLPVSVVCLSLQWSGNFCNEDFRLGRCLVPFQRLKSRTYECQVKLTFLIQIAKVCLLFGFSAAILGSKLKPAADVFGAFDNMTASECQTCIKTNFTEKLYNMESIVENSYEARGFAENMTQLNKLSQDSLSNEAVQEMYNGTANWVDKYGALTFLIVIPPFVFYLSIVAAQLHMQLFSFSLPAALATPFAVLLALVIPSDGTYKTFGFLSYTPMSTVDDIHFVHLALGAIWWLSQLWITRHIWTPKNLRLERVDGLFSSLAYCSVLLEQHLVYSRRKDEDRWRERLKVVEEELQASKMVSSGSSIAVLNENIVPMIYICATMWHENENEMLQMLKSIVRLDEDQATRRNAIELLRSTRPEETFDDPDFYNFEAHIFFDDAMELNDNDEWTVNSFVRLFVAAVDQAASAVFNRPVELDPPIKCPTPYGGRLVWTLPGENKLVVHLKDKNKIRHRKRWSQIMYMYYLLGYKLLGEVDTDEISRLKKNSGIAQQRKRQQHFAKAKLFDRLPEKTVLQAEHTFCLALDGDVDFRPQAVQLLVDRLKRNSKVGVVCGRIHPIGSGPMVWYQKFEYAVSHWLQKAAEHVLGCVLCAPGAFSLFRGSALMDDNVMGTYHRLATEAQHYVQYDQGEDRWLSTLLLQQGYRVEYVAASDALTYAPETFNEFFNQRRRWGPSTMANILDLIMSWRHTIKMNHNISTPFMIYQALIFCSSLLGPATIMLMIAGAFKSVFDLSTEVSYFLSTAPPIFYIIVCFLTKPNTQVTVAAIMSAIYGLLMTAVLGATIAEIAQTSVLSPSGIFLMLLTAVFITTAILHPQEFFCLAPGLLYYISIPSGYLLLIIYSMANLNVVSWGTREVPKREPRGKRGKKGGRAAAGADQQSPADAHASASKKKGGGSLLTNLIESQMDEKSLCSTIARFFRQCCAGSTENLTSALKRIEDKLSALEASQKGDMTASSRSRSIRHTLESGGKKTLGTTNSQSTAKENADDGVFNDDSDGDDSDDSQLPERNDLVNPAWIEEDCLKRSTVNFLSQDEISFWRLFIAKYLAPLDENKDQERKIAADLKNLRNNVCLAFFLMNALWIALMLVIELKSTSLDPILIKYSTSAGAVIKVEPIGLIFLSVFGVTLVLQYVTMLWHRWSTLRHIMATTRIELATFTGITGDSPLCGKSSAKAPAFCSRLMTAFSCFADEKDEGQMLREAQAITRDIQRSSDDMDDENGSGADTDSVQEKDPGATAATSITSSSKGSFKRMSTKRLSLRHRFQKELRKRQIEQAESNVDESSSIEVGGRNVPLITNRSDHLSVKIERLRSTKLKHPPKVLNKWRDQPTAPASDSRV